MKITIIGDVCIDHNKVEKSEYQSFGGPTCYCDLILKTAPDVETTVITNYGPKFTDYYSPGNLIPDKPNRSEDMIYQNISSGKKRTQYVSNPGEPNIDLDMKTIKEEIQNSDAVIFTTIRPSYTKDFLQEMFDGFSGTKIAISQGFLRQFDKEGKVSAKEFDEYKWFLPLFDYATFSDEDHIDPLENYKRWAEDTGCKIIMTEGPDGATLITSDSVTKVPTTSVEKVADSTGSGDIFTAAFLYFVTKTNDDIESIKHAHHVAGECLHYTAPELLEAKDLL